MAQAAQWVQDGAMAKDYDERDYTSVEVENEVEATPANYRWL